MTRFTIFAERPVDMYKKSDIGLVVGIILLWGLGMITLYAASANYGQRAFNDAYYFVKRQGLLSILGFVGFVLCASIKLSFIRKILPWIVIGSFVLCLMTFIPGIASPRNGAHRWISIPFVGETFQPSELAKLAIILFLANWFQKHNEPSIADEKPSLWYPILVLSFFVGIVMLQDDFSTAFFIFLLGMLMFYIAGAKFGKVLPFILLAIVAMFIFVFSSQFRVNRLIAFINPNFDTHGYNYQTSNARTAISAGGFWGQGFGAGLEKINRVPEIQTDYIFAGWVEAMGFVGVLVYVALLAFFSWRAYSVSMRCSDGFCALVGFGCASCILLQSLLNCGVVCGALPATGITLPFFSYGGSSLLVTFCMGGFLVNVSRSIQEDDSSYIE